MLYNKLFLKSNILKYSMIANNLRKSHKKQFLLFENRLFGSVRELEPRIFTGSWSQRRLVGTGAGAGKTPLKRLPGAGSRCRGARSRTAEEDKRNLQKRLLGAGSQAFFRGSRSREPVSGEKKVPALQHCFLDMLTLQKSNLRYQQLVEDFQELALIFLEESSQ